MQETRPWGFFKILEDAPTHKVKRIQVNAGQRLSLQKHERRAELWTAVSGTGVITVGDKDISIKAGEFVAIPCGAAHRAFNPGSEPFVFIEVQTGTYFGEDDIIRLQDDYGRAK